MQQVMKKCKQKNVKWFAFKCLSFSSMVKNEHVLKTHDLKSLATRIKAPLTANV